MDDLKTLNESDNPQALGYTLVSDDGNGHQLWERGTDLLDRYQYPDDGETEYRWSADVSGWTT